MQMECYGRSFNRREQCGQCELRDYCRDAGDIPLLNNGEDYEGRLLRIPAPPAAAIQTERETPKYTRHDVLYVIRILNSLEPEIRYVLKMKIENPNVSLSQIAAPLGITKQAICKRICMYCTKYPFLSGILKNRPLYNRWQQHERKVSMTEHRGGKFLAALIRLGLYRPPMIQPELELFPDGDPDGQPVNFSNRDSKFFQGGQEN